MDEMLQMIQKTILFDLTEEVRDAIMEEST